MIACADLHFDDRVPLAVDMEQEEWVDLQINLLGWILELADREPDKTLAIAGDFFDRPCPGRGFINALLRKMYAYDKLHIVAVPGQHDMLYHNIDYYMDTALATLEFGFNGSFIVSEGFEFMDEVILAHTPRGAYGIYGCAWGAELISPSDRFPGRILLWHHLVTQTKKSASLMGSDNVLSLSNKLRQYGLIITGDNHQPFIHAFPDGRQLLNCGSLLGTKADQVGYEGAAYRIALNNEITIKRLGTGIILPINRQHIEKAKALDDHIAAFSASLVEVVGTANQTDGMFTAALRKYCQENKITKDVIQLLEEAFNETDA